MSSDYQRIDDVVLALLFLTSFKEGPGMRAWKGHDWAALDRLYVAGFISDPKSKARSVVLTDEGAERARALFEQLLSGDAVGIPVASARRGGVGKMPESAQLRTEYLLDHFCDRLLSPGPARLEFIYRFRGTAAVVHEVRPALRGGEAIERPFARLRYDDTSDAWALDWRDGSARWQPYVDFQRRRGLAELLREIDEDPDGVFFG